MDFGEAVRVCLRKYAVFSGRARRSEYWFFVLFGFLCNIGASIAEGVIRTVAHVYVPLGAVASLALFLPQLAANVRRLHDTDRSGWLLGGFYLYCVAAVIAVLPFVPSMRIGTQSPLSVIGLPLLIGIAYAIFLFVLTVLDGTNGSNRYGPDPKAPLVDVF
jgi:uncharacterized membrane protein YhaH (DUF805 family)